MTMTMDKAVEVLGINRTRDGDLKPMVRALKLHPWLNTAAEKARLEAAQYVLRRWDAYQAACNAARALKTGRRA